jgi:uncharacterized protein YdeI (YjbR/CyaY-like superfamily)
MDLSQSVDEYIIKNNHWQEELVFLRKIMQSTEMIEAVKWGAPVYTVGGKNVVGLGAFKSYVGLWFFQGVFLSDRHKKLVNAQEGTTQGLRQLRFQSFEEMDKKLILEYVEEAIANQKAGRMMKPQKKPLIIPDELQDALDSDGILRERFESLNLTMKREFAEYIDSAKRQETRDTRLAKIKPMILEGISLNDKYRS